MAKSHGLDLSTTEGRQKYNQAIQLHNQGVTLFQQHDNAGAMAKFKAALEVNPDFSEAHCNYANTLMNAGQYEEAMAEFEKAADLKPGSPVVWEDLGTCYQALGRSSDSLKAYKKYLALDPHGPHAAKIRSIIALLENEIKRTAANPVKNGADDYLGDATQNGMSRWAPEMMPLKIFIKTGEATPGYRPEFVPILKEAFNDWGEASNGLVGFEYVDNEASANITCSWTNDPNEMMCSAEGGHAMVIPNGHTITRAKLILLTVSPTGGPVTDNYARQVDLHEIGHALGILGHSRNPTDMLFSSLPPADVRSNLSERDKNTIIALYHADASQMASHPLDVSKLLMSGDPSSMVARVAKLNAEANEAITHNNLPLAVTKLEEAHKLDPHNELINGGLGSAYGNCAAVACMARNFPTAEKYFNQAISLLEKSQDKANHITVLKNYNMMLEMTGRTAEAEKIAKRIKTLENGK
jgi:Flp pilus assembly protein TadD